jgi:hypothetical protein
MAKDALVAHVRDELGISKISAARALQAAMTSAPAFAVGALLPLLIVVFAPLLMLFPAIFVSALFFWGALGAGRCSNGECQYADTGRARGGLGRHRTWHYRKHRSDFPNGGLINGVTINAPNRERDDWVRMSSASPNWESPDSSETPVAAPENWESSGLKNLFRISSDWWNPDHKSFD